MTRIQVAEIVLTGHSLGGHLAQYVGTKAYNSDQGLQEKPLLQVRTFNTAPVSTTHSTIFDNKPDLKSLFINYRLSEDLASGLGKEKYYGTIFSFPFDKAALKNPAMQDAYTVAAAHYLDSFRELIPETIKNQSVGISAEHDSKENLLLEMLKGCSYSYECRVNDQLFSDLRAGRKNLLKMQTMLPDIIDAINQGDYNSGVAQLTSLLKSLDGKESTKIIGIMLQKAQEISAARYDSPNVGFRETQQQMKSSFRDLRNQQTETAVEEPRDPPNTPVL